MRAPRPGLLAGLCVGLAALAETGSVVFSWGLTSPWQSVLFGLYTLTTVVIGALIAVRQPRNPVGWILAGLGLYTAVFADCAGAYGHRAALHGWYGGPTAQWIGFGS